MFQFGRIEPPSDKNDHEINVTFAKAFSIKCLSVNTLIWTTQEEATSDWWAGYPISIPTKSGFKTQQWGVWYVDWLAIGY